MSNNGNEDDPFAAFGNDEEGDESGQVGSDMRMMAQSLVFEANTSKSTTRTTTTATTTTMAASNKNGSRAKSAASSTVLKHMNRLCLPWPDPLYLNPSVVLVSSLDRYGGGRGYLATHYIRAGTLILVETPLVAWPMINMDIDMDMIVFLLQHPNALSIFHAIEQFYPTKLVVDELYNNSENPKAASSAANHLLSSMSASKIDSQIKDMINFYKSQIDDDDDGENDDGDGEDDDDLPSPMTQLLQLAKQSKICNSNGKPLVLLDILRVLVALRYNSLETGIFLHVAMLNHADFPNCVKFKTRHGASEVRAIRDIDPGESLTISYVPQLVSHATRRAQLWQHHRFDIGGTAKTQQRPEMEYMGSKFPSSSVHLSLEEDDNNDNSNHQNGGGSRNDSIQRRIEKATAQLDDELRDDTLSSKRGPLLLPPDEFERVMALELASHELASSAAEKLSNSHHVLLLPIRHLHLRACDVVLQQLQIQSSFQLSAAQRLALLGRLIVTCLHLWQLQEMAYGKDYFGLAETLWELAQALEQALSQQARYLTNTLSLSEVMDAYSWLIAQHARGVPASLTTEAAWSAFEFYARSEHKRIKSLYPQDAEMYLRAAQEPKE